MSRKGNSKALCVFLTLLALFLFGTVVVLSTVVHYFGVDWHDVITEPEMARFERLAAQASKQINQINYSANLDSPSTGSALPIADSKNGYAGGDIAGEEDELDLGVELEYRAVGNNSTTQPRIPKIIHQTWKTDTLPERWRPVREGCAALHPDYEYMLWTDAASREFIANQYPWFLQTFDSYPYPIQRADAIRYFVLHYYGGVYMDIDIGCNRSMDPLLYFQVVLPATIPVGVSNDLMMAEKGHPFMDLVIHNLITFDHSYGSNYPTVMFSTGPMFLSAQYGLWPKEDPDGSEERQVRILPRKWYGKNAPIAEQATAYFAHFYGSSWHADDAGFITFLGKFGVALMYLGLAVVVLGGARLLWSKRLMIRPPGAIALPFHADGTPHTRPGTPGSSRPNSPFNPYRASSPSSDIATPNPRGVLYYLPVWMLSPGERPGSSGPLSPSSWTSYLPGNGGDDADGYRPVPSFSRPGSPNNSILHAGGQHDGAFDGVPLRSMSPNGAELYKDRSASPSHHHSPAPPAYSALRSWGSALFRSVPAGKLPSEPATPCNLAQGNGDTATHQEGQQRRHARRELDAAGHVTIGLGFERGAGARAGEAMAGDSVAPPRYAGSSGRASRGTSGPSSPTRLAHGVSGAGGGGDGEAVQAREDGHGQSRGRAGLAQQRTGEAGGDDQEEEDAGRGEPAGGADEEDERERQGARSGGGELDLDEYEREVGGAGLEEEVDRLLEEMAPDVERR